MPPCDGKDSHREGLNCARARCHKSMVVKKSSKLESAQSKQRIHAHMYYHICLSTHAHTYAQWFLISVCAKSKSWSQAHQQTTRTGLIFDSVAGLSLDRLDLRGEHTVHRTLAFTHRGQSVSVVQIGTRLLEAAAFLCLRLTEHKLRMRRMDYREI